MSQFPPIADYAFLSDCEVSGLVAPNGALEWFCLPRPDKASVFGALLDRSAGYFRFGPVNAQVPDQRRYLPGTMVLETTWHTPTGWLQVHDTFAICPSDSDERRDDYRRVPGEDVPRRAFVRTAKCMNGTVEVEIDCIPLFNYARSQAAWSYPGSTYDELTVSCEGIDLQLRGNARLASMGARCYGRKMLEEGEYAYISLSWDASGPADGDEARQVVQHTERYWRDWLSRASIPDHPFRPYIERSALALKGLSYSPTGAVMAAATTSLPETPGGERNWDYRYTWIRDTGFLLRALHGLGFDWEAYQYFMFVVETLLQDATSEREAAENLQVMYGIGGERELTESTLDHLSGYINSRPVRIGNGAYNQQQHDVWGMLVDAVAAHLRSGGQLVPRVWRGIASLIDIAGEKWSQPDAGIWEVRGDPKHFVASKVMCWVALDHGIRIANDRNDTEDAARWQKIADEIKAEVCAKGITADGVFRQHYDTDALDASLLLIPIMGFLPPDDERVRKTVLAIADNLTHDGFVLRYRVETTDDGLSGEEGTFTICTFWLVSALALIGELDRARKLFDKLQSFAGPLLLYAEEIDVTAARHLGNYPQAFTHLALIDAAGRLMDAEDDPA